MVWGEGGLEIILKLLYVVLTMYVVVMVIG